MLTLFRYEQCKRAFFIKFIKHRSLIADVIRQTTNPFSLTIEQTFFCETHETYETQRDRQTCNSCKRVVCQLYGLIGSSTCIYCLEAFRCSACDHLDVFGFRCLCQKFFCSLCKEKGIHSYKHCPGVVCSGYSMCPDAQSCGICLSMKTCCYCKETRLCVRACVACVDVCEPAIYFCKKHERKPCPSCKEKCKVCKSRTCTLLRPRRGYNLRFQRRANVFKGTVCKEKCANKDSKNCHLMKVGNNNVCLKCVDNFRQSFELTRKRSRK